MYRVTANCQDGDIRLSDGEALYEGRVELCLSGVWGTISSDLWLSLNDVVVCRQLGYKIRGMINKYKHALAIRF